MARFKAAASSTTEWTRCADEYGICSFSGTRQVRYGARGVYATRTATASIACNNQVFGDPLPGADKSCEYAVTANTTPVPTPTVVSWTRCAVENATCSFSGTRQVRYGAGNSYATRTASRSIACNNQTFGDPAPGADKTCEYATGTAVPAPAPTPAPAPDPVPDTGWTKCADEYGTCSFSGVREVRYGANGTYVSRTANGSIVCSNEVFGDPVPGADKSCEYAGTASVGTPPVTSQPVPTGAVVNVASCTFAAVQAAVNGAASGSTVNIPAGDCDWGTQQLTVPGGITLRGAGKDQTTIRRNGNVPETRYLVAFDCTNGKRAGFSDMTLVGNGNGAITDKGLALLNGCVDFTVSNSKFTRFIFSAVEIVGPSKQRGVIYQNDFIDNYSDSVRNLGYGVVVYGDGSWPDLELGTQNAIFIEDNYMSGNRHHVASNNGSRYVFRHNTVIATDVTKDFAMADAHGLSSSPRGSRSWEIYDNNFSANLSSGRVYAAIGIRGGDGVIFNNVVGSNIARTVVLELEGSNCGTYPAQDQTRQAWIWNNTPEMIDDSCGSSIQAGRDYFTSARAGYTPYPYPHPLR